MRKLESSIVGLAMAAAIACAAWPVWAQDAPGASLIGKLEGPTIITEVTQYPQTFKEAPQLAEQVKAGSLPPVEQRLPRQSDVMVVKPVHDIGRYGGTWHGLFNGPRDADSITRIVATDKPLFFDTTGSEVVPAVAKGWEIADGGKTVILHLREGHKWSDGEPFDADDFVFWFEEVYSNPDVGVGASAEFQTNGVPGRIEKIDAVTVAFKFEDTYELFVDVLAGPAWLARGQFGGAARGLMLGTFMPEHYLKKFLPKFTPKEELDKVVAERGFKDWRDMFKRLSDPMFNTELPVLAPWKTVNPADSPQWVLERNPYYYEVDTEGNQLPYIDRIVLDVFQDTEVANLKAIAGQVDMQSRHMDLRKLPVMLANRDKGGYDVRLDPNSDGASISLQVNMSYEADPEVQKWLTNKEFRHALSLGIDRDQLNEAFFLGLAVPGSIAPAADTKFSPGPEETYRNLKSTLDVEQANAILDKIGLDKKDEQGFRLRSDGKGPIRLELLAPSGNVLPFPEYAEMISVQWQKIGVRADVKVVELGLSNVMISNNEHQIALWQNLSDYILLEPKHVLPTDANEARLGPLFAKWYVSGGTQGKEPPPEMVKAFKMLDDARTTVGVDARAEAGREIWRIVLDEQWSIGTVGQSPVPHGVRIVKRNFGNAPERQCNTAQCRAPGTSHPATFYFKK